MGPSGADSWVGGFAYVLGPCGSLHGTLLWGWEFLLPLQPPQIFLVRGYEVLFPCTGTLGFPVCLAPQLFLLVYLHAMWDHPVLQSPLCHESPPTQLPVSAPPTSLDECFFFNSLVVGLPYSLIFWQFWLFFAFIFVVLLLGLQGGKVYRPLPPSWSEVNKLNYILMKSNFLFFCIPINNSSP